MSKFGANKKSEVSINDYYAIKFRAIWQGLKQENAAFWWLCVYLFFEYIRPQSIYRAIDILPWGQIALLLACITALTNKEIRMVKNPANVLMSLFVFVVMVSSVFAFSPMQSLDYISIPINWLIVYFLVLTVVDTEKKFFALTLLFLLVNFKMSQHGFITYAERGFSYAKWGLAGSPGWFQNAGDFGIQMAIFTPFAAAFILGLKQHWGWVKTALFSLLPLTAFITIIGTASRGAQLGIVATGLWFLLKSKRAIRSLIILSVLGAGVFYMLPERMIEEYTTAGEDETSQDRLVLWGYGLEAFADNPVIGVGFENWLDYCFYVYPGYIKGDTTCHDAHNTYVESLAEIGLVGTSLFLIILIYIFVLNARTRKNAIKLDNKFFLYMAHGLDGGLVATMISCIFFSILFYPMFWMQLAFSAALFEISKKQVNALETTQRNKTVADPD